MSLFGTGRREGILAVLLLVALSVAVHAPGLFFGLHRSVMRAHEYTPQSQSSPIDQTAEGATNQVLLFPALRQAGEVAAEGEVPLWNPNARFGEPFSFSGAPIWYPPYWIAMAGFGPWSLDLLLALHTILACIGMYRFMRIMPLSRYVSFLGGGAFGLGWFMTAGLDRLPEAAAAALLPFALECAWHCLSTRRSLRLFVPLLGLVIAMMFATGSTTTAWLGVLLCAAVMLFGLTAVERQHRILTIRMTGVAIVGAVLMAAPLWLDWLQHRSVVHTAPNTVEAPRLQATGLVGMVAPNAFVDLRGNGPEALRDVNAAADPLELLLYPGAFVLFLGLLGLLRPKRTYQKLFWLVVGGLGLMLAVASPLHDWIGWSPDRPGAVLMLFHLAVVVLAGLSLETFLEAPMMRRHATHVACGLTFVSVGAFVTVFGMVPAWGDAVVTQLTGNSLPAQVTAAREHMFRWGLPAAIGSGALAALFCIWRRIGIPRFKPLLATFALADACLLALIGVPRVSEPIDVETYAAAVPVDPAQDARHVAVGRSKPQPPGSWLAAAGVPTVDTPGRAILDRTANYLAAIDPSCVQTAPHRSRVTPLVVPALLDHPLLAVSGIGLATSVDPTSTMQFRPLGAMPNGLEMPSSRQLLTSLERRPRTRLVYRVDVVQDAAHAGERLRREFAFDEGAALLEGEPRSLRPKEPSQPAGATITASDANRLRIDVDMADGRGFLMVADAFAPGWHATIDGEPAELAATHLAFRAVALREGEHTVEFVYRPWSWKFGLPSFFAGIALFVGYLAWALMGIRARQR